MNGPLFVIGLQRADDFLFLNELVIHWGVNTGTNINEAINFGTKEWLDKYSQPQFKLSLKCDNRCKMVHLENKFVIDTTKIGKHFENNRRMKLFKLKIKKCFLII